MLPLVFIVIVIVLATWAGWELWRSPLLHAKCVSDSPPKNFIQRQARYQAAFLSVAVVVAVLASLLSVPGSGQIFGIGAIDSLARVEAFGFGGKGGVSWLQVGSLLALGFGLATCFLVRAALQGADKRRECLVTFKTFGWWVMVLAAANALSEELIYRGAVVAVAQGRLEPSQTALLSALLFALAHARGQASGVIVVAGSAVVGWVFAHAVLQTHGLFWAWCVHFIQDAVFFVGLIAKTANPPLNKDALRIAAAG